MSQFKAIGTNPETGENVSILYGYDTVPGFRPGYFFQVYLTEECKGYDPEKENCILNKGMLNGLLSKEFDDLLKKYKVKEKVPVNKQFWIKE